MPIRPTGYDCTLRIGEFADRWQIVFKYAKFEVVNEVVFNFCEFVLSPTDKQTADAKQTSSRRAPAVPRQANIIANKRLAADSEYESRRSQ